MKSEDKPLPPCGRLGNNPPHRLAGVWDMEQYHAIETINILAWCDHYRTQADAEMEKGGSGALVAENIKASLQSFLVKTFQRQWRTLDLESSRNRFHMLMAKLGDQPLPWVVLKSELDSLRKTYAAEVCERHFIFIKSDKEKFFERDNLFGEAVTKAFPSANNDIREAGNCISLDLNTAAVFHMMRAVELGLRALAKHLRASVPRKPLELAQWDEILGQIQERIDAKLKPGSHSLGQKPKKRSNKKKAEDRLFYRGVMGEFYGFKDVWRNNVMHTRRAYNEHEALGVYQHVRDFMNRLAARVSE